MRLPSFLLFLFMLCCIQLHAQMPMDTIDVSSDIVLPKHYIVSKTNDSILIDGLTTEASWQNATFTDYFLDIKGVQQAKFETRTKMLWDDKFLYVYAELKEPHIWGDITERDAIIYYNNDFEVFIDPSGTAQNYGEIEINALNTVWDLYLNKAYRVGGGPNFAWNLDELKSAVKIYGSLNYPYDTDSMWTVEMAIPLRPLLRLKNRPRTLPREGEQWRINFSRVEWDVEIDGRKYSRMKLNGQYLPEYNWVWSPQKVINMHEPEKWGYLQFTNASSANGIKFIEDPDLEIKQVAYALFRKTRFGKQKGLQKTAPGYQQTVMVSYAPAKDVRVTYYRTHFGFEYKLKSPITNTTYFINEEGVLKSKP